MIFNQTIASSGGSSVSGWEDVTSQLTLSRSLASNEELLALKDGMTLLLVKGIVASNTLTVTAPFYMMENRYFKNGKNTQEQIVNTGWSHTKSVAFGGTAYYYASDVMLYLLENNCESTNEYLAEGATVEFGTVVDEGFVLVAYGTDDVALVAECFPGEGDMLAFDMPGANVTIDLFDEETYNEIFG